MLAKRAEDRIVAGCSFSRRMEKMPEQEVQRVRLLVALDGQRPRCPFGLRTLQQ